MDRYLAGVCLSLLACLMVGGIPLVLAAGGVCGGLAVADRLTRIP